ncbi:unnamed protein product, partial [marine sediment metagenome]
METMKSDTAKEFGAIRVGVALGQRQNFTAIIVVETNADDDTHRVRQIVRPRLGIRYTKIVKEVDQIRDRIEKLTGT